MTLTELLKRTRSYRSFDRSVPVTREDLAGLVACVRYAPSSMNAQMLKFRPVTDTAECEAVLAATRWAAKLPQRTFCPSHTAVKPVPMPYRSPRVRSSRLCR